MTVGSDRLFTHRSSRPRPAARFLLAALVQLWELPGVRHTAGLREHPSDYERRTTTFLNRALGL